ncbi:MAG TPA: UDP-N-acetylmuramate dehydrogenase [Pyrinomonadaceae bacterium]|nr:UDP-N-acetylmuramate dehydrogenase [Pyrinomonadaceae bacterium]
MIIQENISLAPLTTLKIGGPARYFVRAENESDVIEALSFASGEKLNVFVLGGGSNILVADRGFDGIVIQIALKGVAYDRFDDWTLVTAMAGEDWDTFVKSCVNSGLAGIECMSGIPGFVGGTPVQNVGAYGQEVAETIESVRCLDRLTGQVVVLSNLQCGFSYRTSIFNSSERGRYIVLSVAYRLTAGGEPKVVYKDLIERFSGAEPTLNEVRKVVLDIRRAKSMVLDPSDPNSCSAGSFFKNPVITTEQLDELRETYPHVPSFAFGDDFKIPAAWLIENAGFNKGYRLGRAGISSNHTLAIVNLGDATAADVITLKDLIQNKVLSEFGIPLEPEPVFIGFA